MATSRTLPVDCSAPPDMRLSIEPSETPRPTCLALAPPCVALGAAPPADSWASESLKVVRPALKPIVLTLAMSFAVTSSIVWWDFSPLIAENMLLSIGGFLPWKGSLNGGDVLGVDAGDAADGEGGKTGRPLDALDHAGGRDARVGVGV